MASSTPMPPSARCPASRISAVGSTRAGAARTCLWGEGRLTQGLGSVSPPMPCVPLEIAPFPQQSPPAHRHARAHTHTHTNTHTCTQTHGHIYKHKHTHTTHRDTQTHTETQTHHTHRYVCTHRHMHTHRHTHMHTDIGTNTHSRHTYKQRHRHTNRHTHTHTNLPNSTCLSFVFYFVLEATRSSQAWLLARAHRRNHWAYSAVQQILSAAQKAGFPGSNPRGRKSKCSGGC